MDEYITWEVRRRISLNARLHTETQKMVDDAVARLADALSEYIRSCIPNDWTGITEGALQGVNWEEVARHLLDDYFFYGLKYLAEPLVSEEDLIGWGVNNQ